MCCTTSTVTEGIEARKLSLRYVLFEASSLHALDMEAITDCMHALMAVAAYNIVA